MAAIRWKHWRIDLLGALCCAAIAAIAFISVAQPIIVQRLERASLLEEIVDQRGRTADLRDLESRLVQQRDLLRERLAGGEIELQPTRFLNTRLALIVDRAAETGIVIDETRSGETSPHPLYQTVPLSLSGTGSYPACAAYLHDMHELLPDTGVVSFELAGDPGRAGSVARFRFDLVWFAAPVLAAGK